MRLYVGTLYTIENEYEQCLEAISRQSYRNYEHRIYKNLGKKEAHDALYGEFVARRAEFDLLVKVDADMVLCDRDFFSRVVEQFRRDPSLGLLTVAVHDWFTDRLIFGLNTYRNTLDLECSGDSLFTDRRVRDTKPVGRSDDTELAPAAFHCPNPSPFQAFHFGLHKAVKVVQPYACDADRVHWRMRRHWDNIMAMESHFERSGDRRLALAILGADAVFAGLFGIEHISYSHPESREYFSKYADLHVDEMKNEIRRLRRRSGGWLSPHMRRAWLWYRFRRKHVSLNALKTLAVDIACKQRKPRSVGGGEAG